VFGVATAVAVLAGALLVGDSVRGGLRDLVVGRLGATDCQHGLSLRGAGCARPSSSWPVVRHEALIWRLSGDHDPRLHISLGITYAGLGRKSDALRETNQTLGFPLARVGFEGSVFIELAALISTNTSAFIPGA
jgi:hypothetical protein